MKWFYGLFRLSVLIFVLEAKFARVHSLRLLLFARTLRQYALRFVSEPNQVSSSFVIESINVP